MSASLQGKIVFITGASSGIGAACARAFDREGARLILCARRMDRLEELAAQLNDCHLIQLDVRDADAVRTAVERLPDAWQNIDVLVNNAGLSRALDPVHRNLISDIDVMVDTNVKGLLYVTRFVAPGMVARGTGHIIQIGSIAGRETYPGGTVYTATKHAVRAINEGLKKDLHGTGIRVSSVDPGLVETEFSLVRFDGDSTRAGSTYTGMTPLTADDIADAVLYCATRPPHVNISDMLLLPTDQSGATMVHRRS